MFGLFKKREPQDLPTRLVNQAIGGQSVMYRFFREGLGCVDSSIRKLELSYFAMSVLSVSYLAVSRDPRRTETLNAFTKQMLQRALKATASTESYETVEGTYQGRFGEYQALLRAILDPHTPKSADPAVTLLMHAYEQITASSAEPKMTLIMVGGKTTRQFVADNLDFVRRGLPPQ